MGKVGTTIKVCLFYTTKSGICLGIMYLALKCVLTTFAGAGLEKCERFNVDNSMVSLVIDD